MAGDWIKMRVNLVTHPKVLAISEFLATSRDYQDWSTMSGFVPACGGSKSQYDRDFQESLRVTRYVTVCALLRFWGYANEHAKDEFITTLRVTDIDDIVQVPSFGAALEEINWVEYDEKRKGLKLPNFNEYNTSGNERSANAKSAAQRQKEYRDRKKETEKSDVTRDVTVMRDSNRREEKRREEKSNTSSSSVPDCPHEKILDLFGEHLPNLAQPVKSLWRDGKNAPALAARWSWVLKACHEKGKRAGERLATNEAEGLAWFGRFFAYVADSDFLSGRQTDWACDLIWLVNKSNFEKVIQGSYENKEKAA